MSGGPDENSNNTHAEALLAEVLDLPDDRSSPPNFDDPDGFDSAFDSALGIDSATLNPEIVPNVESDSLRISHLFAAIPERLRGDFPDLNAAEDYPMARNYAISVAEKLIDKNARLALAKIEILGDDDIELHIALLVDLSTSFRRQGINLRPLIRGHFLNAIMQGDFRTVIALYKRFFQNDPDLIEDTFRSLLSRKLFRMLPIFYVAFPDFRERFDQIGKIVFVEPEDVAARRALFNEILEINPFNLGAIRVPASVTLSSAVAEKLNIE